MATKLQTLDARTLRFCALSCRRKANLRRSAIKSSRLEYYQARHDAASIAFEQAADNFLELAQRIDGKGRS